MKEKLSAIMPNQLLVLLICLLSFTACSSSKKQSSIANAECVDLSSFDSSKSLKSTLFPLAIRGEELLGASSIAIADNLLCVESGYEELQLKVFDLKGNILTELIPNGKANNELLVIVHLGYNEYTREMWAYDPVSQKLIIYNIDTLASQFPRPVTYRSTSFQSHGTSPRSYVLKDALIRSYIMADQKRFTLFDTLGQYQKTFGEYPTSPQVNLTENMLLSELWNGCFTSNGKDKLAICTSKADLISIYDIQGNMLHQIHGPNLSAPIFELKVSGRNNQHPTIAATKETQSNYVDIVARDSVIWVLYNAKTSDDTPCNSQIFTYDWNAKPLNRYELDRTVHRLDVSPLNKTIYGLDRGEGLLYTFKY